MYSPKKWELNLFDASRFTPHIPLLSYLLRVSLRVVKIGLLIPFLFLPLTLTAQLLEAVIPQTVGVNIHFVRGHEKELDMIAAAGCRFIRMDFSWEATEPATNQFDWSAYDELTENLQKRGLRPMYILDYTHARYETKEETFDAITHEPQRNTASPRHPSSIAAFARWAAAAAKHYHGQPVVWEIYNEPNGFFWKPKPNAEEYTALALATGKAIRESEPNAVVIAPALSGFEWPFFETFVKSGVLQYLDGVSVHPYRDPKSGPETAEREYAKLRKMIDQYAPAGKGKLPIISGEWGYSSHRHGVSEETQAAFLARQQLFNLLWGIPISIWYDWKNDGPDRNENEHNFGMVAEDLNPKPAYRALQTLTHELSGFRVVRRMEGYGEDFVVLFAKGKEEKFAVWTAGAPHEVIVDGAAVLLGAIPKYVARTGK